MARTPTRLALLTALAALGAAAACAIGEQKKPDFVGPSELAVSLAITATPDTLPRDGAAQSVVAVVARDAYGNPLPNLTVRADIICNSGTGYVTANWGTLSTKTFVTGSDGRATAVYTAPAQDVPNTACSQTSPVWFDLTPVGTNYLSAITRFIALRLVEPDGAPMANFTYSPSGPTAGTRITFDASSSSASPGHTIVSWDWDFGGGSYKSGVIQTKQYDLPGSYTVTLTVTEDGGRKGVSWKRLTVQ